MFSRSHIILFSALAGIAFLLLPSCSTKKNTIVHRTFHNVTARYNGYFYARESLKEAEAKLDKQVKDNYHYMLPVYKLGTKEEAKQVAAETERAFKKASRVIQYHSINLRGKEYVKWIDENYLAIGISHYYNHDYYQAAEVFDYIAKTYKDQETRYLAMIWMIRANNELTLFTRSQLVLDLLNNDKEFPEKYRDELAAAHADYLIKRENYELARLQLKKAIELSRKKKKARYTYILAQLEEKEGNKAAAAKYYDKIRKLNPTYEMGFHARMKNAVLADLGDKGARSLKVQLLKMARDAKNADYLDQIFYALAEIELKEGNRKQAEKYLMSSAASSVGNDQQKAMAYLRLAELFFADPVYPVAFNYYDSTIQVLPRNYPQYDQIRNKRNSLADLVENLNIINKQDSLLRIAMMDSTERNAYIDALIEARLEEEERKKEEAERLRQQSLAAMNNMASNDGGAGGVPTGGWYFYNPSQIGLGVAEFKRKFGERTLADNWRRKNKQTIDILAGQDSGETDGAASGPAEWQSRDFYLTNLPLSAESMQASRNQVLDAYYNTGNIYREQLQDYNQSIQAFETMIERFDTGRYYLPGLYQLYRLNLQVQNQSRADYYKSLITSRFPESTYAQLVQNPDYLKERKATLDNIESLYEQTYQAFLNQQHSQVISYAEKADTSFAKSEYLPKFALLRAMSSGAVNGTEVYITRLEEIVANYATSPEALRATEIIAMLKKEEPTTQTEVTESPYTFHSDTTHMAVILMGEGGDVNQLKAGMSNFNSTYFAGQSFNISSMIFKGNQQMVVVSGIPGNQKAIQYFKTLEADKVLNTAGGKPVVFIISSPNYPVFYKEKDPEAYLSFFRKHYSVNP